MPRKDRTFSAKDIIRFVDVHLTDAERVDVIIALCLGVKIEVFDNIPILVTESAESAGIEETDFVENLIELLLFAFGR